MTESANKLSNRMRSCRPSGLGSWDFMKVVRPQIPMPKCRDLEQRHASYGAASTHQRRTRHFDEGLGLLRRAGLLVFSRDVESDAG